MSSPVSNSSSNHDSKPKEKHSASDCREFVCGWGAAFINITVTFPMNKVMFRQVRFNLLFFLNNQIDGEYVRCTHR